MTRARGGRLRRRGKDEPARVRLRHHLRQPALRRSRQPARPGADPGRLERRSTAGARRRALRSRSRHGQRGARSASPPRAAESSASSRPRASCSQTASSRSRRASTRSGPWRATVAACAAMMGALGRASTGAVELGDLRVGLAWLDLAEPLVRRPGWRRPPHSSPTSRRRLPAARRRPQPGLHASRRPRCTASSSLEHADLYGDNVRRKIEAALAVTDAEYERRSRRASRYKSPPSGAARGVRSPSDADDADASPRRPGSATSRCASG